MITASWDRIKQIQRALWTPDHVALAAVFIGSFLGFWMILRPVLANKLYLEDDLLHQNIPIRFLYAQGLRAGRIDIWAPTLFNGWYMHGEGQTGMYHPLHLLLYRFVPFTQAVGSEILINYLLLWIGSGFLFYRWTRDWMAACFGAFVFTFAGPLIPSIVHINKIAVLAHIPWTLLALDCAIRGKGGRTNYAYAVVALLNGSAILFGYPYFFLLLLIFQAWYAAYLLIEQAPISRLLYAACAIVVGFAIGAVQLLPTWDLLHNSSRAQPSFAFLSMGSLYPINILQWANPYYLHNRAAGTYGLWELSIYAGIGPTLLFLWLCTQKRNPQKNFMLFLLALAVTGLFLALGEHNHLFRYYYTLPVLSFFRMPCRFSLLTIFAIAGGSAIALKQLRVLSDNTGFSKLFNCLAVCLFFLSVITYVSKIMKVIGLNGYAIYTNPANTVFAGCVIVCSSIGLFCFALRYRGWCLSCFCVFAVFDIGTYSATYLHRLTVGEFNANFYPTPPVPAPAALALNANTGDDSLVIGGYSVVNAYTGLEPNVIHSMSDPEYLRALGVSAIEDNFGNWIKISSPGPSVRFERPLYSSHPIETMNTGIDLTKMAVVSRPLDVDASAVGSVWIVEQHPGFVRIAAESSGRMLCVLVQRFYPGWIGESRGKKIDLMPVDGDLTGFIFPGGHQEVTLVFQPWSLLWGRRITCIALLLVAFAVMAQWLIVRNEKLRHCRFASHPATVL